GKVVITGCSVGRGSLDEAMARWDAVQAARAESEANYGAAMENYRSLMGNPTSIVLSGKGHFYKPGDVYFH
ncbi:unnamed protein product, partial [marine sediment metagenome]